MMGGGERGEEEEKEQGTLRRCMKSRRRGRASGWKKLCRTHLCGTGESPGYSQSLAV